jgi:hypothetical protein
LIDIVGKGFGRWNTMPTTRRTAVASTSGAYASRPSRSTLPSMRAPATVSCIRLIVRMNVDFPHPDGPMSAVTFLASRTSDTSSIAL